MDKNKKVWFLFIVIILLGIWIVFQQKTELVPNTVACTDEAKICSDGSFVSRQGSDCEFAECQTTPTTQTVQSGSVIESDYVWEFKEFSPAREVDGRYFAPRTRVILKTDGNSYDLGVQEGNCSQINTGWTLLPNEIDGVICYHAGFGNEVGIFKENNELVVKQGVIEEGTPEDGGLRGGFKVLFKLPN